MRGGLRLTKGRHNGIKINGDTLQEWKHWGWDAEKCAGGVGEHGLIISDHHHGCFRSHYDLQDHQVIIILILLILVWSAAWNLQSAVVILVSFISCGWNLEEEKKYYLSSQMEEGDVKQTFLWINSKKTLPRFISPCPRYHFRESVQIQFGPWTTHNSCLVWS